MVNQVQLNVGLSVFTVVAIISCGLFAGAWSVLDVWEYGLNLNTVTRTIQADRVYVGGRYMLGLGHTFVRYPRELRILDWSRESELELPEVGGGAPLQVGTSDGQSIVIEVTVFYAFIPDRIPALYAQYGPLHTPAFEKIVQTELKNVAIEFSVVDYFSQREEIANTMLNRVASALKKVHVDVQQLLLRAIQLPSQLETSLVNKLVAQQQKRTAIFNQRISLIEAQTSVFGAIAEGNITQINGNATADATTIRESARAKATTITVDAQRQAYAALKERLNFTNTDLLKYLWASRRLRRASKNDTLLVGFDNSPIMNIRGG